MIILTILLFILILGLLIFAHELGHFVMAKRAGMKVEEFGFGFPPRLLGIQILKKRRVKSKETSEIFLEDKILPDGEEVITQEFSREISVAEEAEPGKRWKFLWGNKPPTDPNETVYSINWIPLGGFVKILGENGESQEPNSFSSKSAISRFSVLIAGVTANIILAWLLISIGLMIGSPTVISENEKFPAGATVSEQNIGILYVSPDSPADKSGFEVGDKILSMNNVTFATIQAVQDYTVSKAGQEIKYQVKRGDATQVVTVVPRTSPPAGEGPVGVLLGMIGTISYPWYLAFYQGLLAVYFFSEQIILALGALFVNLFTDRSALGSLTGPIGIAVLTRDAARLGAAYVLNFTAILSVNLAVLNALPFPALDGGRILFLLIEKIRRKKLNIKVETYANALGFLLLITLMVWVSFHDVGRFSTQFGNLWEGIKGVF
ncbi:MAG: M50 family metallopeptidase [Patescibacteria group bacterium]